MWKHYSKPDPIWAFWRVARLNEEKYLRTEQESRFSPAAVANETHVCAIDFNTNKRYESLCLWPGHSWWPGNHLCVFCWITMERNYARTGLLASMVSIGRCKQKLLCWALGNSSVDLWESHTCMRLTIGLYSVIQNMSNTNKWVCYWPLLESCWWNPYYL